MNNSIDHDRCSELLAPFTQGQLDDTTRRAVKEHLAACEQCRAEQRAVARLSGPLGESLTGIERARLHREVWDAVALAPVVAKRPLGARLAPYLGTAAALVILAVGIVTVGGSGDDDSGAGDGGNAVFDAVQPESESGAASKSVPYSDEDDATRALEDESEEALKPNASFEEDGSAGQASDSTTMTTSPHPVLQRRGGTITAQRLDNRGSSGYPFVDYAAVFTAAEARERARGYMDQLAAAAGPRRNEVAACGNTVFERSSELPLAAYGALGRFESRPVLVVGFATSDDGQRLDTYTIWVFNRGDCDSPIEIRTGAIAG